MARGDEVRRRVVRSPQPVRKVVARGQDSRFDLGFRPIRAGCRGPYVAAASAHRPTRRRHKMPEQTTAITSQTTTDQHWDRRPALTLLAVILAWYVGTIGVVLTQAF